MLFAKLTGCTLVWLCLTAGFVSTEAASCATLPPPVPDTVWPSTCRGAADGASCAGQCRPGRGGPLLPLSTCVSGTWSTPQGACRRVCIGTPPAVANAVWDVCTNVTQVGVRCSGSCPAAAPNGRPSMVCGNNGWDTNTVVGRCSAETVCSQAPPVTLNAVWPSSCIDTAAGGSCSAVCRAGYGPGANASCGPSGGDWAVTGSCRKVCTAALPDLPGVQWDTAAVGSTPVGQLARGSCGGETPSGGVTIRCVSSGWDLDSIIGRCSSSPVCMTLPPTVINGKWPSSCIGTDVGSSCSPSCNAGYVTGAIATCDASNTWSFVGACNPVYQGDKQALLRGPNWGSIFGGYGWKEGTPLCAGPQSAETFWPGVDCLDPFNKPGVVGRIMLPLTPLLGQLPPSWGDLKEVRGIDVSLNFLTGPLPESWGRLKFLEKLDLSENRQKEVGGTMAGLSGTIPASWAGMTSLDTLLLAGNDLEGTIPASFRALTKLSRMSIDRNPKLSGYLPGFFSTRPFMMSYMKGYDPWTGHVDLAGPFNYGAGGLELYTGSGPLWRTQVINWEGKGNNSATNPDPQPRPDTCSVDPNDFLCM